MEQQTQPPLSLPSRQLPYQPSKNFRERIIYQSPSHTIPHECILKMLGISSYAQIPSIGVFSKVMPVLTDLPGHLQEVDIVDELNREQIYLIAQSKDMVQRFTNRIIQQIPNNPFFLGVDRSYMQQLCPRSEIIIDEQRQYCLKWVLSTQTQSSFVAIYLGEELVVVGKGKDAEGKDFKGIKIYNREGFLAVEMGLWKGGFPVKNVQITFPKNNAPVQVYLRTYQGKKRVEGQLRYLSNNQICIYREGNSTISSHQ